MQFFHLFSFVVVASYAAALPQPAGKSEKYSNNVDTNLASGLEARSYQPVLNSYKDSATLTSLKRRDSSEGSAEEDSGVGFFILSTSNLEEEIKKAFTDDDVSTENISSTIDRVGDGIPEISVNGELAGKRITGTLGDMVARYLRRAQYVNIALDRWTKLDEYNSFRVIESGLSEDEYSKIKPFILKSGVELLRNVEEMTRAANRDIFNISGDVSTLADDLGAINIVFMHSLEYYNEFFEKLRSVLGKFPAGQTLYGYLSNAEKSIDKFDADQYQIYEEILDKLEAAPSE
ncbi:hypothetical protein BASA62_007680 [Batrachochytrium salamandrivorans]|nr:hypothetical protein BASA62_007680 [Batrachochytrium salamandrivorans]